jgi:hypothetical protein
MHPPPRLTLDALHSIGVTDDHVGDDALGTTTEMLAAGHIAAPGRVATARPQLAKADTAFQAHPLVNRLNLA